MQPGILSIRDKVERLLNRERPGHTSMDHSSNRPLRVLVVEDEPLIRWSISETLTSTGHTVLEAHDGMSAVRVLNNGMEPVDVVLLDYRLPDSNDLDLLARIRRLVPRSVILLMTAFGTPEVRRGALELGAFGVVDKPFDMQALEPMLLQAHASIH